MNNKFDGPNEGSTLEQRIKYHDLIAMEGPAEGWVRPTVNDDGTVPMPLITICTSEHPPTSWRSRAFRFLSKLLGFAVPSGNWVPQYFKGEDGTVTANVLCRVLEGDDLRNFIVHGEKPAVYQNLTDLFDTRLQLHDLEVELVQAAADFAMDNPGNRLMGSYPFSLLVANVYHSFRRNRDLYGAQGVNAFYPGTEDTITMSMDATDPNKVTFTFHHKPADPVPETLAEALAAVPDPIPQYDPDPIEKAARAIAEDNARTMGTDRD